MYARKATSVLTMASLTMLIGMTIACKPKKDNGQEAGDEAAVPVTVVQAEQSVYTPVLRFSGTAEESKKASLGTAIPGRVEKIHYAKGSYVPKGALIAEMSDEMMMQAQIENDAIKRDFERISRLREKESVSKMDYDHVKAKYEASVAKVALLKKNTSIIAPFSGIITNILVNEGETYTFNPSITDNFKVENGIVELRQLNPLKVVLEINEKELGYIKSGQSVLIAFDAQPGDTVKGKISYIPPVLSAMTRTASVEVSIPNDGLKLKPGMYCNVSIEMPKRTGVFVPLNSIYRLAGTAEEYVFKVNEDGSTVSRIPVVRGEINSGNVRIEGDEIRDGDMIVSDGKNKLNDGSKINIVKKK